MTTDFELFTVCDEASVKKMNKKATSYTYSVLLRFYEWISFATNPLSRKLDEVKVQKNVLLRRNLRKICFFKTKT